MRGKGNGFGLEALCAYRTVDLYFISHIFPLLQEVASTYEISKTQFLSESFTISRYHQEGWN